jgi:molybdopterin converting factor small subunit
MDGEGTAVPTSSEGVSIENAVGLPGSVAAMARLRLFAGLRDVAGTSSVDIDAPTVGRVIESAGERFGPAFSEAALRARVWVNGDEAEPEQTVGASDEVALIPPVSGGAGPMTDPPGGAEAFFAIGVGLVLIFVNSLEGSTWWAVAVVGVIVAWMTDVAMVAAQRARDIPLIPGMLGVVVAVVATRTLGVEGVGVALVISVILPLAWSVASDESRALVALVPSLVVSVLSTAAVSSLLLARESFVPINRATGVLITVSIGAVAIGTVIERFSHLPFGDPFTATTLGAIGTSLAIAAVWDLDLVTFLIMGVVIAASLIAGRGLGSMLRTRRVELISRPPGLLASLDGLVLAAAVFLPVLRLVA